MSHDELLPPHLEDLGRQLVGAAEKLQGPPPGGRRRLRSHRRLNRLLNLVLAGLLTIPLLAMATVLGIHAHAKPHRALAAQLESVADVAAGQDWVAAPDRSRGDTGESARPLTGVPRVLHPPATAAGVHPVDRSEACRRAGRRPAANDRQRARAGCPSAGVGPTGAGAGAGTATPRPRMPVSARARIAAR